MWTYAYVCITFLSVFCAAIISFVSFPHISSLLSFSYRRLTHTHTAARRATDTHTHIHKHTHTSTQIYMHTYILPHTSTHTHIQSTRTHTERARPAAAAFFRFFFRYTPCFRIYFSYSPLYVREKIKKKNRRIAVFFQQKFYEKYVCGTFSTEFLFFILF